MKSFDRIQSCLILVILLLVAATLQAFERSVASTKTVRVGQDTVTVELAMTPTQRERGLSGRTSLPANHGMLFVFPSEDNHGFWMKDMRFAIDIVWLDRHGRIVTIEPDVAPESYPAIFYPTAPTRFVLEVPSGFTAAHELREGSTLTLPDGL